MFTCIASVGAISERYEFRKESILCRAATVEGFDLVGRSVECKRGLVRMTVALRTPSIGEVENIHTQMACFIAADIADMRTPVGRKNASGNGGSYLWEISRL